MKVCIKIRKSRMWIPALGVVLAYGFLHNCVIAPHSDYHVVDWNNLILGFAVVIGIGGARDVVLKKFAYLGDVVNPDSAKGLVRNKLWIPFIGWCLVLGFFNNICLCPYFDAVKTVEWSGLMAALSVLLTVSGARDYGIYARHRQSDDSSAQVSDE